VPGSLARVSLVVGVEDLTQSGSVQTALVAAAVAEHVSDEVHRAALPRAGQHPRARVFEAFVLI